HPAEMNPSGSSKIGFFHGPASRSGLEARATTFLPASLVALRTPRDMAKRLNVAYLTHDLPNRMAE
ncbi:MAG TPA: hypothetical protein VMU56_03780, partial [Beijerinckiaceae bacterium]|nr:hypothetical protein [Beijerinckiaceae bacterium]